MCIHPSHGRSPTFDRTSGKKVLMTFAGTPPILLRSRVAEGVVAETARGKTLSCIFPRLESRKFSVRKFSQEPPSLEHAAHRLFCPLLAGQKGVKKELLLGKKKSVSCCVLRCKDCLFSHPNEGRRNREAGRGFAASPARPLCTLPYPQTCPPCGQNCARCG